MYSNSGDAWMKLIGVGEHKVHKGKEKTRKGVKANDGCVVIFI